MHETNLSQKNFLKNIHKLLFLSGNPEPLVFHAPQVFFECLQQRISAGNKKKRLPNFTTGFIRKDALPLGTFTKYTWHIINILHVKQIFDTAEVGNHCIVMTNWYVLANQLYCFQVYLKKSLNLWEFFIFIFHIYTYCINILERRSVPLILSLFY